MNQAQFAVGAAFLASGVLALVVVALFYPPPPPSLSSSVLTSSAGTTLPSTTNVPSNTTVMLPGIPQGAPFGGNFSVRPSPGPTAPPVSFYLLDRSDWSTYNTTFQAGHHYPTSFVLAVANRSSLSWNYVADNDTPFAALYIASSGGFANVSQSAYFTTTGGVQVPIEVSPLVEISPGPLPPSLWVVDLPTTGTLGWGIGGSFQLGTFSGSGASLYVLSPNGSSGCPSSAFSPSKPECASRIAFSAAAPPSTTNVSWFVRVHGVDVGWSLDFLSSLYRSSSLSYNTTVWSLPPGPVLDATTWVEAVAATLGFFGFLAATGALVTRKDDELDGAPSRWSPPTVDLVAPSPTPTSSAAASRRPPWASRPSSGARTASRPATSPAPLRAAVLGPSVPVRVTCGICGTGYPVKGGRIVCPVCGSKAIVDTPPTGMQLL
jgi:hypothetical protein